MSRTTLREALAAYGDSLSLAALGALEKKGESEEVHIIFVATHGVLTNFFIRVRDHARNPISADIRAVLSEMARGRAVTSPWSTTSRMPTDRSRSTSRSGADSHVRGGALLRTPFVISCPSSRASARTPR